MRVKFVASLIENFTAVKMRYKWFSSFWVKRLPFDEDEDDTEDGAKDEDEHEHEEAASRSSSNCARSAASIPPPAMATSLAQ